MKKIRLTEQDLHNIITESVNKIISEMNHREAYTEAVPTWALCYIVNGDATGLEEDEINMIDNWMRKARIEIVSPRDEDPYFTHYPAFGLPTDVMDCDVIYK